jgi:hypothetical protein
MSLQMCLQTASFVLVENTKWILGFRNARYARPGSTKHSGTIFGPQGSVVGQIATTVRQTATQQRAVSLALSAALDNTLNPRDARTVLQASIFQELHVCHARSTRGRLKAVLCVSATLATSVHTVMT